MSIFDLRFSRCLLVASLLVAGSTGCAALREQLASEKSPGQDRIAREQKMMAEFEQNRATAEFTVAVERAEQGDLATSQQMLQTIVARQPDFAPAHVKLAELHWLAGDLPAADIALSAAAATAGERADIHHALGVLLEAMGRPEPSHHHLSRAAQLEPGNELYRLSASPSPPAAAAPAPQAAGDAAAHLSAE
jgi:Tfp pilus assembly protein PilF